MKLRSFLFHHILIHGSLRINFINRVLSMGFVSSYFKKDIFLSGLICIGLMSVLFITSVTQAKSKNMQTILVWGDSLSAAYGIPVEKGWVNLLQGKLGDDYKIINGSISGETTQGGLTRLPNALKMHNPDFVILELGANDGLRGISPQITKNNLQQMIEQSKQTQAEVLLLGMKIPPNYGVAYSEKFEAQFADLANTYNLPFIPFFLENVIENLDLLQADQLHPTAEAQPIILESILPSLKKSLKNAPIAKQKQTSSSNI